MKGRRQGWLNRRHHVERRLPVVEETEMSASDFERYFVNGKSSVAEVTPLPDGAKPVAVAEDDDERR
jgi:hypothetical protein